jgi:penicillin-binding protein 1C
MRLPAAVAAMAARLRRRWRALLLALLLPVALLLLLDRIYPPPLPDAGGGSVLVVARDGTPLRAFPDANGIWRYPTTPEQVAPAYLQALIEYEDRWFHWHYGINPLAMLRAAGQWAGNGRIVSGGSTLTMQVARIIDPQPRTLGGKLRQMLRALQLEWRLSKREILTLYLNHAPFGGTIEGVEAASWAYLGKPASQLSDAEAALLAVLPQAPSRLRPDRHPDAARRARDKVLERMGRLGVWSRERVLDATIEPVVARRLQPPMIAPLLAERLRREHPGRQRIDSSIDAGIQRQLEARLEAYFSRLPERTSAALLVVDNRSGQALAYIGSLRYGDPARLGHVDMVQAARSPGSTLKPFLYGMAIDEGLIHSESLLVDAPQSFGDYRPGNFDPRFNGPVSAAEALRLSLNVPAVDLLDRLGPATFSARLAHAGVNLRLPRGARPNLSMILGGTGTSLEELVGAYLALQGGGLSQRVVLQAGSPPEQRRLLSPGAARIVRDILASNRQTEDSIFAVDRAQRPDIAWKTGTSYGFRDAWAIGSSPRYTVGVWVGRPDGTPLPGQYGAITALPLLFDVFDALPGSGRHAQDAAGAAVEEREICWPLGLPVDMTEPSLCQQRRNARSLPGRWPPTLPERGARSWDSAVATVQVDARSGRRLGPQCSRPHQGTTRRIARWPALLDPWLSAAQREASRLPPLAEDCANDGLADGGGIRIEGINEGALIAAPSNRAEAPMVRLRALGAEGRVQWLVDGRLVGASEGRRYFDYRFERAGEQRVLALAEGGAWDAVNVRIAPFARDAAP